MSEKPIIFSGPMVRALLAGTKTQTRRLLVQPKRWRGQFDLLRTDVVGPHEVWWWNGTHDRVGASQQCPYGKAGDTLWVKETWRPLGAGVWVYRSTAGTANEAVHAGKWRPSIFMPRKIAQLLLRVTAVRVERLQEISVEDALAEGIEHRTMNDPRVEYRWLWDSINAKRAPWGLNPWVWVITFERLLP